MTDTLNPKEFRFGRVVSRTFNTISGNLNVFFPLGLLLCVGPQMLVSIAAAGLGITSAAEQNLLNMPANLVGIVFTGSLIWGALAAFDGRPVTFLECLRQGGANFGGQFGVGLLSGLGIVLGFVLLIVPGLFLMTAWSAAGAMRVAEGVNASEALGRSHRLTKGARWPIFGLVLLLSISFLVTAFAIAALSDIAASAAQGRASADMVDNLILTPVFVLVFQMVAGVGTASIYRELTGSIGGAAAASVAATFD